MGSNSRRRKANPRPQKVSRWYNFEPRVWQETSLGFMQNGLEFGTAQIFGPIEIVPIIRQDFQNDFRVLGRVSDGKTISARIDTVSWSLVPGGVVGADGQINSGARIHAIEPELSSHNRSVPQRAKRERHGSADRLSFVREDIGCSAFMSFLYGVPYFDIYFQMFNDVKLREARFDYWRHDSIPGARVPGLAEALRVFEIIDGQVGSMVWINGQLAGILVLPHPDDYRSLHYSLLGDWYAQSICDHANSWAMVPSHHRSGIEQDLAAASPRTVAELREVFTRMQRHAYDVLKEQLGQAFSIEISRDGSKKHGPFSHSRLHSKLVRNGPNYIGELIERESKIEYMQLMRLNHAQSRRAYLLWRLEENAWDPTGVASTAELANVGIHIHSLRGSRLRFWVWA